MSILRIIMYNVSILRTRSTSGTILIYTRSWNYRSSLVANRPGLWIEAAEFFKERTFEDF